MAVPKRRTSASKRDKRRAHDALVPPQHLIACPQCGERTQRHRVCPHCGTYRGRQVVAPKEG